MTAELAILNKSAVALAADSAVTIGYSKVFNTANKLFNLNKKEPIGIMIYGAADCLHVPWETIIKTYRSLNLTNTSFDTIKEQAEHFVNYVSSALEYFPKTSQEMFVEDQINFIVTSIVKNVQSKVDLEFANGNTSPNLIDLITNEISECHKYFSGLEFFGDFNTDNVNSFLEIYDNLIIKIKDNLIGNINLPDTTIKQLKEISCYVIIKNYFPLDRVSGIVISGFGVKEFYPSIAKYTFNGMYNDKMRYKLENIQSVSIPIPRSLIIPLAQTDMVRTFIEGVNPNYAKIVTAGQKEMIQKSIQEIGEMPELVDVSDKSIILKKIKEFLVKANREFFKGLSERIEIEHVNPILDSVSTLPKEELAVMAESLVYLTYLKRRFSEDQETVGGAIDVAVITKGDGFIWIKRKHYFNPDLNPHFFENYFK